MSSFLDDLDAMGISAAYVLTVLLLAEVGRRRGIPRTITRKFVHVFVGLWVVPTFLLFDHRLWAVVPPACFVIVNAVSFRFHLIRSVEGESANVGTILYPISTALALGAFWEPTWRPVGAAAILALALGDAAGSLVGRRFGRHVYRAWGHPRSLEGSLAMFVFSVVGVFAAFAALGGGTGPDVFVVAVLAAAVATVVEAGSLWGFDNVLIPASVAVTLVLSHGSLWS